MASRWALNGGENGKHAGILTKEDQEGGGGLGYYRVDGNPGIHADMATTLYNWVLKKLAHRYQCNNVISTREQDAMLSNWINELLFLLNLHFLLPNKQNLV